MEGSYEAFIAAAFELFNTRKAYAADTRIARRVNCNGEFVLPKSFERTFGRIDENFPPWSRVRFPTINFSAQCVSVRGIILHAEF